MCDTSMHDYFNYVILQVKISELPAFRLPKRLPAKDSAVLRPDRDNEFFNIKFSESDKQMFYIDRNNAKQKSSGKTRVKPSKGFI